ncbi:MAG: glycosyltransferase family 4 protein [Rhodobacteraceae bacterium]|nr:glycosyltransferase family 4 protein [Paracoccaceae bacterium]
MKTCLQVLPALVTGGVERGTVDVARALSSAGWRALVASRGGPMVREIERAGAMHIELPLGAKGPFAIKRNAAALAKVIRDHNVSLIHARSRAPAWSAKAAAAETSIPFVTTFHGAYDPGPFGAKKLYNRVMADGDLVIAISEYIARVLREDYRTPPERIRLIHRGIDLAVFDPSSVSSQRLIQLSQKLRLTETTPTIMLPGRLTAWKGHVLLVEALGQLRKRHGVEELRCLMVGQGQGHDTYKGDIEDAGATYGVADWVHVVEDCNDLPAAYLASDVVISASTKPEAFGRVVAEAQAMGRPVVAPAHGAAAEIIVPGVTGWLFTPGDPVSLADAVHRALSLTADERVKLADTAMSRVRKFFDKAEMCAKTLAVYDELLGAGARAAS